MHNHFEITYHCHESLPCMAWGLEVDKSTRKVKAYFGNKVEVSQEHHAVIEGAWDGVFENYNFHAATVLSGSGFRVIENELLICSSTDRLTPIFSHEQKGRQYFSNSAIFLMSLSGTETHPNYPFYDHDILKYWRLGDYAQCSSLKLNNGKVMLMHMRTIVVCKSNSKTEYRTYKECPEPDGYDEYFTILSQATNAVLKNATSNHRKTSLDSASAITKGYDSTAVARLARDAGCKKTYTLVDSRSDNPHEDSGVENARVLGMTCKEFDRWEYQQFEQPVEPEFCTVAFSNNAPIAAMENDLRDHIYFTGPSGDCAWDPKRQRPFLKFSSPWMRICSGLSQIEFRLRVGYLVFSPPSIAGTHSNALTRIVESQEMQNWHVAGGYNRPIARRIAETGGIPREQVGCKKLGTGHTTLHKKVNYSKKGHKNYIEFFEYNKNKSFWINRLYWKTRFTFRFIILYKILRRKVRYIPSSPLMRRFPFLLNAPPLKHTWEYTFTFQWAFNHLKNRYQIDSNQYSLLPKAQERSKKHQPQKPIAHTRTATP